MVFLCVLPLIHLRLMSLGLLPLHINQPHVTIKEHSVSWFRGENRRHALTVPWVHDGAVTPGDIRSCLISGRRRRGHIHLVIDRPAKETTAKNKKTQNIVIPNYHIFTMDAIEKSQF